MSEYIHYITGLSSSSNSTLPQMITQIRDSSALFCAAWTTHNRSQAERASKEAMYAFDFICNAFLRARDDAKNHGRLTGPLARFMNKKIGRLASPVTRAEQQANAGQPNNWGNGNLPTQVNVPTQPPFDVVLNKIKHRTEQYSNFRIVNNRHILVVAGDLNHNPNYILEFDVIEFCDICDSGSNLV